MRKIEMIIVVLLLAVFTGIAQTNAATNAPAPVTNINAGLSRLTSAIDQRADKYMLSESTVDVKIELNELVNGVKTDIEISSKKSGLEFGKVVVPLAKIYDKRIMTLSSQIMECEKNPWPTEACFLKMLEYNKNKVIVTTITLAMIDHYLGSALKELGSDGEDDSARKLIEQELEKQHGSAK